LGAYSLRIKKKKKLVVPATKMSKRKPSIRDPSRKTVSKDTEKETRGKCIKTRNNYHGRSNDRGKRGR